MLKTTCRWGAIAVLMAVVCLLGGCNAIIPEQSADDATAGAPADTSPQSAPDVDVDAALTPEILPAVEESMTEQRQVTLYFRMQSETMLSSETRTVYFPRDRQVEEVLITSLIEGPSPGLLDLTGLFSSGTKVYRVWRSADLLTVTLTREFLSPPPGAPVSWDSDPYWRTEVFNRRQLAIASIVNTITEETDFTAIQFLVLESDDDTSGRRIRRAELYPDASGDQLLPPVTRSEHFILTHYNTANVLMESWRSQAYDRIYRFVAQESGQRPTEAAFQQEMITMDRSLVRFSLSAGTVSEDGQRAVLEATYEYISASGNVLVQNYPMRLVRENGLWRIVYEDLQRMMEAV